MGSVGWDPRANWGNPFETPRPAFSRTEMDRVLVRISLLEERVEHLLSRERSRTFAEQKATPEDREMVGSGT